ncbi:MAG: hypothetical protein MUP30_00680 [Deltaproteobacteria bacterium]|nr:hypothetical protein [Deltaproteobacteria bacterium]
MKKGKVIVLASCIVLFLGLYGCGKAPQWVLVAEEGQSGDKCFVDSNSIVKVKLSDTLEDELIEFAEEASREGGKVLVGATSTEELRTLLEKTLAHTVVVDIKTVGKLQVFQEEYPGVAEIKQRLWLDLNDGTCTTLQNDLYSKGKYKHMGIDDKDCFYWRIPIAMSLQKKGAQFTVKPGTCYYNAYKFVEGKVVYEEAKKSQKAKEEQKPGW